MTKIYYYQTASGSRPIVEFLDSISKLQKAKIFRIFEHFKSYGATTAIPHIRKLTGSPLWEIKLQAKTNIRIIYATIYKGDVLVLHGFIKKKQKTPSKDLKLSLFRLRDWQARYPLDK